MERTSSPHEVLDMHALLKWENITAGRPKNEWRVGRCVLVIWCGRSWKWVSLSDYYHRIRKQEQMCAGALSGGVMRRKQPCNGRLKCGSVKNSHSWLLMTARRFSICPSLLILSHYDTSQLRRHGPTAVYASFDAGGVPAGQPWNIWRLMSLVYRFMTEGTGTRQIDEALECSEKVFQGER